MPHLCVVVYTYTHTHPSPSHCPSVGRVTWTQMHVQVLLSSTSLVWVSISKQAILFPVPAGWAASPCPPAWVVRSVHLSTSTWSSAPSRPRLCAISAHLSPVSLLLFALRSWVEADWLAETPGLQAPASLSRSDLHTSPVLQKTLVSQQAGGRNIWP